ncbi:MAG: hypothetical protein AAF518_06345 [Spirochaetota bacterium]
MIADTSNMKKITTIVVLVFTFFCSKEKKNTNKLIQIKRSSWSSYQGEMNWYDAKEKCTSIGMRLPSSKELVAAYTSGVNKKWDTKQTNWYWASDSQSAENAYYVSMHNGDTNYFNKMYKGNQTYGFTERHIRVRCYR